MVSISLYINTLIQDDSPAHCLAQTPCVSVTCSNLASKLLTTYFHPDVILIDEAAQAKELESWLPMVHNVDSLKKVILLGDPKQLSPTVKSMNAKDDKGYVNIFAKQVSTSLMSWLFNLDSPTFFMNKQFRMVAGLTILSNLISYSMKMVDAEISTDLTKPSTSTASSSLQVLELFSQCDNADDDAQCSRRRYRSSSEQAWL